MALSDYERRVLNEIETDLSQTPVRRMVRWLRALPRRLHALVRRRGRLAVITALCAAVCVVVGGYTPALVAAAVAAPVGFVLGCLWGNRARLARWGRR
ncbi:MAG TPA: DUF3040 domain-containing protein [Jatrophihabitans sp.]|nr:DUF3040 domain-containing protein [Jatrophihabitans sp.]